MRLVSINIAKAESIDLGKRRIETGIFKRPVDRAELVRFGLVGDSVCNAAHHGGADQAVYVYGLDDYRWLEDARGRSFAPGEFGENLTIDGLRCADFAIGDRLAIGDGVVVEVTAPRIPCNVLGARVGDAAFPGFFRSAERPGFYCRVIDGGELHVRDAVSTIPYPGERVTVTEMFRAAYDPEPAPQMLERLLRAPIAVRERRKRERQLAAALSLQR